MTKKHPVESGGEVSAYAALDEANRLQVLAHKARDKATEATLAVEVSQQSTARALILAAAAEKAAREAEAEAKTAADEAIAHTHRELHTSPAVVAPIVPPKDAPPAA